MSFERAQELVVGIEGGFSDDPHDPGNYTPDGRLVGTKYGISARAYPHLDIRSLTLDDARALYRVDYWMAAGCDELPWPLSLFVFDCAVNQGVNAALDLLPLALKGVSPSAANDWHAARYMALRCKRYSETRNFDRYGIGWMTRCFTVAMEK